MHWEVEQKYRIEGDSVELELAKMGVQFTEAVRQTDHYFNHPQRDFAVTDEALRIRQVGVHNFVTYKGPKIDLQSKTRQETEIALGDGMETAQQFGEILRNLGFRAAGTVLKTRRSGQILSGSFVAEVAIDQVERLGTFLEIEISADDGSLPAAQTELKKLTDCLRLRDPERRSYLELLLEHNAQVHGK